MAKAYTGRVSIPGDKIEEYLKLLKAAEEERAPFTQHFMELHKEFYDYLADKYTERTARKHAGVIEMFI